MTRRDKPIPAPQPQIAYLAAESDAPWTADRIRALGTTTDLATAARIFQLSRSVAYDLAKRDQFPIAVLRFGTRYKVPVSAILHALQLPAEPANPTGQP